MWLSTPPGWGKKLSLTIAMLYGMMKYGTLFNQYLVGVAGLAAEGHVRCGVADEVVKQGATGRRDGK